MEGRLLGLGRRRDLVSMSRVCSSWREAVISYPLLWNTIANDSELVTRMCLERSKSLPLTVSHFRFRLWCYSTWQLLSSHSSRFETLSLEGKLSCGLYDILINLEPTKDPILRKLTLRCTKQLNAASFAEYKSLPLPILSKDIPTLHKISLACFPLTPQLIALRHLTTIELIEMGSNPVSGVLDLLANNPHVEQLVLIGSLDNDGSHWEDLSIALPHLRRFDVCQCDSVDILRCLHLPRLENLKIDILCSFEKVTLPRTYQPYSIIQLARGLKSPKIHLRTSPKFYLKLGVDMGEITAGFGELPPMTAEALGPSTVQFIKYLQVSADQARPNWRASQILDAFSHMERLETLALDCSPISLEEILLVLNDVACCPLLRTLIIRLPPYVATDVEEALLGVVRCRADSGNAIRRLRVIVSSEEYIPTHSKIFEPLLQEVQILVCKPGARIGRPLLVWED